MDWSITLLLAAVLLLDGGVQRIGSPSLVLRRAWSGPWRVARVLHVSGWRTIGVWPSAVITLVLTETDAAPPAPMERRRWIACVVTPWCCAFSDSP